MSEKFVCKFRFGWNAGRNPPLSPLIRGAGEYTAMHFASGRVRRKNRTYRAWVCDGYFF